MMVHYLRQTVSITVLSVALLATGARAEDKAAVEEVAAGEIIVTAQRRSESINKVPLSVQAFDGETLTRAGVTDVSALPTITAGLSFARSSANTPIYTIRGVGFNTPNLSSTSPVGAYFNEVAYPYPYMTNGPFFDLERVEVLKGPQGTLYGRNTTGGLINFVTAKPGKELAYGATVELGNYQTYNVEGYVSAPLSDTLRVRLAGRWENSDKGWQRNINDGRRLGKKDRLGLRATVIWEPTDKLELNVVGSYWRDRSDTIGTQAVFLIPNLPPFLQPGVAASIRNDWTSTTAAWDVDDPSKPPFRAKSDFYGVAGRLSYKMSDALSLVSLTSYNHVKRDDTNDIDGSSLEVFAINSFGKIDSVSEELRLLGEYDRFNFTLGGYYAVDKIVDDQIGYFDRTSILNGLRFIAQNLVDPTNSLYTAQQYRQGFRTYFNRTRQRNRTASLFGNVDYELTDQLKLSAGLRYTDDQLRFSACSTDRDGNTLPIWNTAVHALVFQATGVFPNFIVQRNGCLTYSSDFKTLASFKRPTLNEHNLAGRLGIQYSPNRETLLYATVSRGYKSGAVPQLPTNVETQLDPARQEKLTAYEAGAKLGLANRAVQLNLAAFYYDYRNKQLFSQVPDIVFTTLPRLVNVPKSSVAGAELELEARPTPDLTLHLSTAYTKTKIQRYVGFNRAGLSTNFAGQSFPYSPRWQVNGSFTYEPEVGKNLLLATSVTASYQSATSASIGNDAGFGVKAYTLVNASVTLHKKDQAWKVGLYANNLFDKYYWTAVDRVSDLVFRVPGTARTFGLRASFNY